MYAYHAIDVPIQVYARLGAKDFTGKLDLSFLSKFGLAIKVEDVVEFRGAEGCAKSEILLNIAAKYLTSKKWNGTSLTEQHNDVQVVFVSTDLKFDISRLTTIVENQITMNYARSMYPSKFPDINSVVLSAMSQMQVFYCNSTTDLLHMLLSLHTSLCNNPQVCILMVDNVANFYWSDKNEGYGFSWRFEQKQPSWTTALQELIEEHQIVVFATRPLLFKEMGEKVHVYMQLVTVISRA